MLYETNLLIMKAQILLLILSGCIIFSSCEKKNEDTTKEIPEDLFAQWIAELSESETFVLYLEKTSTTTGTIQWHMVGQYPEQGDWIILIAVKGTFTINGNTIFYEPTHVGAENPVLLGGPDELSDTTVWYASGNEYFDEFASAQHCDPEFDFVLDGDLLTLYSDDNCDGDFNDEGEVFELSRVN